MSNITLTVSQQKVFDALCRFVQCETGGVFILKGYAGTGKTTMMKFFVDWLKSVKIFPMLMAPTGRAAKVIRTKTNTGASTIHRAIYDYDKVSVEHGKEKDNKKEVTGFKFVYGIKKLDTLPVCIVDEASMVSSCKDNHELFKFGTGVLLDDLLTFSKVHFGGKVIFIGDNAQLPPVGDNESKALNADFFRSKNINVQEAELTEVLRQSDGSCILSSATKIRNLLNKSIRNELVFDFKDGEVETATPTDAINTYVDLYRKGKSVKILCWSNALAQKYNSDIRRLIFPRGAILEPGDIIQIVKNSYNKDVGVNGNKVDIFNGDFAKVLSVSPVSEVQSAPVWVQKGTENVRETVSLHFRDVSLELEDGVVISTKIIEELIYSDYPSLSIGQMKALYINFKMRYSGVIERTSSDEARLIMKDPYYNAVQAKYGYSLTGHKSQGGEWDTVFVDYSGRGALNDDALRWMYTTTTRAKKLLRGINMPEIDPLSHISFLNIEKVNSVPFNTTVSVCSDIGATPFHSLDKSAFLREKYFQVLTNAKRCGCDIVCVVSCQFLEKYQIRDSNGDIVKVDCYYNKKGFSKYITDRADIKELFERDSVSDDNLVIIDYPYADTGSVFHRLYDRISIACNNAGSSLVFVDNQRNSYKLLVGFKTDVFSYIEFYYNSSETFTKAIPRSIAGESDVKLKVIISELCHTKK